MRRASEFSLSRAAAFCYIYEMTAAAGLVAIFAWLDTMTARAVTEQKYVVVAAIGYLDNFLLNRGIRCSNKLV